MANLSTEIKPGAAERKFVDLMQHGDDFYKIELWRHARTWYQKALDLNMETEKVHQKIAECDQLLVRERKIILVLVAIAVALVLITWFVF